MPCVCVYLTSRSQVWSAPTSVSSLTSASPSGSFIRVPLPSSTPLILTLTSVSISFPPSSWSSSESPFTSQSPPVFCLHLSPPYITVSISFRVPLMSKRSPLEPPLTSEFPFTSVLHLILGSFIPLYIRVSTTICPYIRVPNKVTPRGSEGEG